MGIFGTKNNKFGFGGRDDGFDDYVEATGYCIAEWSENISDLLPEDSLFVEISRTGNSENERIIEIFTDGIYEDISL